MTYQRFLEKGIEVMLFCCLALLSVCGFGLAIAAVVRASEMPFDVKSGNVTMTAWAIGLYAQLLIGGLVAILCTGGCVGCIVKWWQERHAQQRQVNALRAARFHF